MKLIKSLAVALLALSLPDAVAAQNEGEQSAPLYERNPENAESYRLDLTVPESPAFAILGLDSPEVATPRDMPSLATELANFFDDNGELKPGGAITMQPYWFGNRNLTLDEYRGLARPRGFPGEYRPVGDFERRWLARTSVSLALADVEGQDDAARLGVGVTFRPLDGSDPRFDRTSVDASAYVEMESLHDVPEGTARELPLALCLKWVRDTGDEEYIQERADREARASGARGEALADLIRDKVSELRSQLIAGTLRASPQDAEGAFARAQRSDQRRATCVQDWRRRQSEEPNLLISVGQTFFTPTGRTDDLESESLSAWVGYSRSVPIGRVLRSLQADHWSSRVNLYARYAESEEVTTAPDTTEAAEVSVAAISFNVTREQEWSFGVEAAYRTERFSSATDDREFTQVALNGAYRLNDQMWIRGSYGTRGDDESEFVRISLVFAERAQN